MKIKEYYFGLLSGFRRFLAIRFTTITKITLEIVDIKEAPNCIKFAYMIEFDNELQALPIKGLVYISDMCAAQ
jgi:hypothetical protein